MADTNMMNKPLDGQGLSVLNGIINQRLNKKADTTSLPTKISQLTNDSGFITDGDIPEWAKSAQKPSYTAAEVGAIPSTQADTFVKKSDIAGAYIYRGSVANFAALPSTGVKAGDVYNTEDTNMNYGWTGTKWDPLTEAEIKTILGETT